MGSARLAGQAVNHCFAGGRNQGTARVAHGAAVQPGLGVARLHDGDGGAHGARMPVSRVALQDDVEVTHRAIKIMTELAQESAQHAHFVGRIGKGPPGLERSLRIAEVTRVTFATDQFNIAIRQLQRQR